MYYLESLQRVSTLAENRIERIIKDYVHDNGLTREPLLKWRTQYV
jgi:hypothetical protein